MNRKVVKCFKVVTGAVIVIAGLGLVIFSIGQIVQGQLLWASIVAAGAGITLTGIILIAHKSIRDFWEVLRDVFGI